MAKVYRLCLLENLQGQKHSSLQSVPEVSLSLLSLVYRVAGLLYRSFQFVPLQIFSFHENKQNLSPCARTPAKAYTLFSLRTC